MPTTTCDVGGSKDAARVADEPGRFSYSRLVAARDHGRQLQERADRARKAGDYRKALARYSELLPVVSFLEEAGQTGLPPGMSMQLLQRGIELAEELAAAPYLGE
jgi:hypothetical protein